MSQEQASLIARVAYDKDLHGRAKALARRKFLSMSELIRAALREYLDIEEKRQDRLEKAQAERRNKALNKPIDEWEKK